jgi:adenylosuccinate synthase
MSPLKVCIAYTLDGKEIHSVPARTETLARCKPVWKEVVPIPETDWPALVAKGDTIEELSKPARLYVELVEGTAGCPVTMVGVGPARKDIIWRRVRAVR